VRRRSERGQATLLIVGFAGLIAMVIAVVVDASAAYLQRSGLDSLADGAALHGADLGATGEEVYAGGVPAETLGLTTGQARAAVADYLRTTGAHARYPGLTCSVTVDGPRLEVHLSAPLDLPLAVPGARTSSVGASGAAIVGVDD
jgi:uncharacterized membrane protein